MEKNLAKVSSLERQLREEQMVAQRLKNQLEQRNAEFQAFIETIPQQVWTAEPDGTLNFVNERVLKFFNRTFEEMIGWNWKEVIHPDDLPHCLEKWSEALKTGRPYEIEFRLKRGGDGEFVWHLGRALPLRNKGGTIVKWMGTNTDISSRKRSEEELVKAKEFAEAANQAKSKFLAAMSHEIRTPLNAIIGMADVLWDDSSLVGNQKETIRVIRGAGINLLTLIDNILDLSKIEAGHFDLEEQAFDIRQVLKESLEYTSMQAYTKGLGVNMFVDSSIPGQLWGDSNRIRQIIINLLGNAIKFTPQGEISVKLRPDPNADTGRTVLLSVSDTGPGISPDKLETIFDPFVSGGYSVQEGIKNTGLGLSICKNLVEKMGGRIWVESQVGQGSTFYVVLSLGGLPKAK